MNRSQIIGMVHRGCGVTVRSVCIRGDEAKHAAVALPIAVALSGLSVLAIWVGWMMATAEKSFEEPEFDEEIRPAADLSS